MSIADALAGASSKALGRRPYFMEPDVERALQVALAAAGELAVARQRIDTLERLLEARGIVTRAEIEAYAPGPDEAAERGLWMQEYLVRVLRVFQQEREALEAQAEASSEEVADELARRDG